MNMMLKEIEGIRKSKWNIQKLKYKYLKRKKNHSIILTSDFTLQKKISRPLKTEQQKLSRKKEKRLT